jgi:pimeloyl-ACP methyl ester carboxylesterase
MLEDSLTLKDGRLLAYGVYGNPSGIPILDFHGIPGSRREAELVSRFLERSDLRLIGFDRPGYGHSSPKPHYQISDITGDVVALLDHLEIPRCIGLGFSGGAPFALACAQRIPERFLTLGIISGVGPAKIGSKGMHASNRKKFNLAQRFPWLTRVMLSIAFSHLRSHPEKIESQLRNIWQQMPEPDQDVLQDESFAESIISVTRDAISHSVKGWVNEELLMASSWGFELGSVACPHIFLWHGVEDRNVPLLMAKAVADRLPNCQATFVSHEGHISLLFNHGAEIIDTLVRSILGQ